MPLYSKDSRLQKLLPVLWAEWGRLYAGFDWVAEIKKAHAWEIASPERRKIRRGKFLNGWLSRAFKDKKNPVDDDRKYGRKPELDRHRQ